MIFGNGNWFSRIKVNSSRDYDSQRGGLEQCITLCRGYPAVKEGGSNRLLKHKTDEEVSPSGVRR